MLELKACGLSARVCVASIAQIAATSVCGRKGNESACDAEFSTQCSCMGILVDMVPVRTDSCQDVSREGSLVKATHIKFGSIAA